MKGASALGAVCALASLALATPTSLVQKRSLQPVTASGNAFFIGNERFYIKGVDYQPGGSSDPVDPIANPVTCKRDIAWFKKLGINTIRVYTVDNTKNHDECMDALADAGIYLALDVNNGLYSLNRDDPAPSYNNVYLASVFATIDAFKGYSNTLLFFSGNEVINAPNNTNCAPYIKAVTRDMKTYIQAQSERQIMVGYSAADVSQNRVQTAHYMDCGTDGIARSDFFAFNDYSWCGDSSFTQSGWKQRVKTFSDYSIPLFLSEYGCNTVLPRTFGEVNPLYSMKMSPVYSGGMLYEYTEESDNPNFGLVEVTGATTVKPLGDFFRFQKALQAANPPNGGGGFKQDLPISKCPAKSHNWDVNTEALPAIPAPAEKYIKNGAPPGPGLAGKGSQNAGVPSSHWVTVTRSGITNHKVTVSGNAPPADGPGSSSGGSSSSGSSGSGGKGAAGSLKPISAMGYALAIAASSVWALVL